MLSQKWDSDRCSASIAASAVGWDGLEPALPPRQDCLGYTAIHTRDLLCSGSHLPIKLHGRLSSPSIRSALQGMGFSVHSADNATGVEYLKFGFLVGFHGPLPSPAVDRGRDLFIQTNC